MESGRSRSRTREGRCPRDEVGVDFQTAGIIMEVENHRFVEENSHPSGAILYPFVTST